NSHSSLSLSFSPCSLIKGTKPVSAMLARRDQVEFAVEFRVKLFSQRSLSAEALRCTLICDDCAVRRSALLENLPRTGENVCTGRRGCNTLKHTLIGNRLRFCRVFHHLG